MARSFNGSTDKIGISGITAAMPFSFSFWAYSNLVNTYSGAIDFDHASNDMKYYMKSNGKSAMFQQVAVIYDGTGAATVSANTWFHVCVSIIVNGVNNEFIAYLNGVLDIDTVKSISAGFTSSTVDFGVDNFASNQSWGGRLADEAMWNVQLTAGEISALARGARPGNIRNSHLTYWLPFDGIVSPEPDLGGSVHNGTLTGTALAAGPPAMPFTPRWHRYLGWTPALPAAGLGWIINRRNKLMTPKRHA